MRASILLIPAVIGCQSPGSPDQDVWYVSGTVLAPDGPVSGADVRFSGSSEGGWFGGPGREFSRRVDSDAEGRFTFRMVSERCEGYYSLRAEHPDYYQPGSADLPDPLCPAGASDVTLRLERRGTLSITTTSLPPATLDAEYSFSLEATGAQYTTSWSIVDGSLPPGLTLLAYGVLQGTPTSPGVWEVTIAAASPDTYGAEAVFLVEVTGAQNPTNGAG